MAIVEVVLQKLDIQYEPCRNGEELKISCPNPLHDDRNPSCFINSTTGLFHCFSCQFGGGLEKLIKVVTGEYQNLNEFVSIEDTIQLKIGAMYKTSTMNILKYDIDLDFNETYKVERARFKSALKSKKAYKYLTENRNFTKETIKKFNLQFCNDGFYENRVIITYKKDGNIIGFNSRFIGECSDKDRYRYFLNDVRFSDYIFNIENVVNNKYCIIVEGPFDLMYMQQLGFKNVISTLNTRLTEKQLLHIIDFEHIIFCYDNDIISDAGNKARIKNANMILNICPSQSVVFMDLPEGKDPNKCSKAELQKAWKNKYKVKQGE